MHHGARLGLAAAAVLLVVVGGTLGGLYAGRTRTPSSARVTRSPGIVARAARTTDEQIAELQARIARRPDRALDYSALGAAYLQKAREGGDPTYYARAEAVLQQALTLEPEEPNAVIALGGLALARHQFEAALALGERATALTPYKAAAYGVVADAQIELGRYDDALATIATMLDLRPDLSSYARVSYIHELHGDIDGAVEAMRWAVEAGATGSESLAWTRVQLGHLEFSRGQFDMAEAEYRRTLVELPGYLHARAGLARVAAARGDYATAMATYDAITKQMPVAEYVIALAEVQWAVGNTREALQAEGLVGVLDRLQRENGVNTDAEMALFAADHDIGLPGALADARQAVAIRPSVYAYDVLAWTLYKNGHDDEALAASDQALRLGSRDSLIRFHAGMIAARLGQAERARAEFRAAIAQNPYFSLRYHHEAVRTLRALDAGVAGVPMTRLLQE